MESHKIGLGDMLNKLEKTIPLALATVLSVSMHTPAQSAGKIGGVDFYPSLDLSMVTTDNLYRTSDREKYSVKYIVTPGVRAEAGSNLMRFYGEADAEIGRISRTSGDDDYEDVHLSLGMIYEPTSRARFQAEAGIQYEHDDRGTGFSEGNPESRDKPDEYTQRDLSGQFAYGALGAKGQLILSAEHNDIEYTNNRPFTKGFDRDDDSFGALFKWQVAPKTRLTLEGRYKDIEYDFTPAGVPKLDSEEERYFVGVEWEATYKTTGRFQIGQLEKNFDSSLRDDYDDTAWEASVTWKPRSYSTVDLETGRTTSESTGTGDATATDYYQAAWTHDWRERFSTTARYRHEDNDYPGSTREDDYNEIQLSANYKMRTWLDLEAGYVYRDQDTDFNNLDYTENQFYLNAGMRF
jgi:hypothetical protein